MTRSMETSPTTGHPSYIGTLLRDGTIIKSEDNPGVRGAYQVTWMLNGYEMQGSTAVPYPTKTSEVYAVTINVNAFADYSLLS